MASATSPDSTSIESDYASDTADAFDEWNNYLPVPFTNTYDRLPADAPAGHPHIIDIDLWKRNWFGEEQGGYDVKIQDAVVTLLHKVSKDILGQFLDNRTTSFKLLQWPRGDKDKTFCLVIWKKGAQVLVGSYLDNVKAGIMKWDNIVRCNINADSTWDLVSAAIGKIAPRGLDHVWSETFVRSGWSNDSDGIAKEVIARGFSQHIIEMKCWDGDTDYVWDITTKMAT